MHFDKTDLLRRDEETLIYSVGYISNKACTIMLQIACLKYVQWTDIRLKNNSGKLPNRMQVQRQMQFYSNGYMLVFFISLINFLNPIYFCLFNRKTGFGIFSTPPIKIVFKHIPRLIANILYWLFWYVRYLPYKKT